MGLEEDSPWKAVLGRYLIKPFLSLKTFLVLRILLKPWACRVIRTYIPMSIFLTKIKCHVKTASSGRDQQIWERNVPEPPQEPMTCIVQGRVRHSEPYSSHSLPCQAILSVWWSQVNDRILEGHVLKDLENSVVLSYSCLLKISSLKGSPQVGAVQGKGVTMHNKL